MASLPVHGERGWRGRLIEKFDPRTVEDLEFDTLLTPEQPSAFELVLGATSRWHIVRWGADFVSVLVDLQPKITYCWRSSGVLQLDSFPLGEFIALVPQGVSMHPKTQAFIDKFNAKHGTGKKTKSGHPGTVDPAELKEVATEMLANAKTVRADELPALLDDIAANLDSIVAGITN